MIDYDNEDSSSNGNVNPPEHSMPMYVTAPQWYPQDTYTSNTQEVYDSNAYSSPINNVNNDGIGSINNSNKYRYHVAPVILLVLLLSVVGFLNHEGKINIFQQNSSQVSQEDQGSQVEYTKIAGNDSVGKIPLSSGHWVHITNGNTQKYDFLYYYDKDDKDSKIMIIDYGDSIDFSNLDQQTIETYARNVGISNVVIKNEKLDGKDSKGMTGTMNGIPATAFFVKLDTKVVYIYVSGKNSDNMMSSYHQS